MIEPARPDELPRPEVIHHLRIDDGRSYAEIAQMYGARVEDIYRLAHHNDPVTDLQPLGP